MPEAPHTRKRQYSQAEPQNDWLERLTRFNLHFGRFLRDAIGLLLIAFAVMFLLAVFELIYNQATHGTATVFMGGAILAFVARWLTLWFGWGSLLILFGIGYIGYSLLRRDRTDVHWGQIIALEVAALLTLGLLAVRGGNNLIRAEAGWDGGRLGWGLITLAWRAMSETGGTLVIVILWALAIMTGFGLWRKLEEWLLHIAGEAPTVILTTPVPGKAEKKNKQPGKTGSPASRKKAQPLPVEFRTSLKSDKKEERLLKPPPRGEDLPPLQILLAESAVRADDRTINQTAGLIMKTLSEFGIPATVIGYRVGPAVTQFAVQPGFIKKPGSDEEDAQQMKVRVAQIASLEKDIALALSAQRLRIEAPVPGKPYVGIEVPNTAIGKTDLGLAKNKLKSLAADYGGLSAENNARLEAYLAFVKTL